MGKKQGNTPIGAVTDAPQTLATEARAAEALLSRAAAAVEAVEDAVPEPADAIQPLAGLEADVSGEIADAVPSLANVLKAIGYGVAAAQAALDQGLLATVQALANTKIEVVTDVIQELDDDGLPIAENTELVKNELSLLTFFPPPVHRWSQVDVALDFSVGQIDATHGLVLDKTQWSNEVNGKYFWGFGGWFDAKTHVEHSVSAQVSREQAEWMRGQVQVDALLSPVETARLPVAAEATIGPQIFFSLGTVRETKSGKAVTARSVDLLIQVIKADGSVNPQRPIEVDAAILLPSFKADEGFDGSTTNAQGKVLVTLTRNIPNPLFLQPIKIAVRATLGAISRAVDVTL